MPATKSVRLGIVDSDGQPAGFLGIALLPGSHEEAVPSPLIDERGTERESVSYPVQLLEGSEYRFTIDWPGSGDVSTDTPEIFGADDNGGRTGRLSTGLYVGSVEVTVLTGSSEIGKVSFEVRSRKLEYQSDYQVMLRDIASTATEVVMERFAPSQQAFDPGVLEDPRTQYQRFSFLQSLFESDAFQAALNRVLSRPYHSWESIEERRTPGRGIHPFSGLSRQIARPGPRRPSPDEHLGFELPASLTVSRTEATLDNPPNQFFKFALQQWRELVLQVHEGLRQSSDSSPVNRGLKETQQLLDRIDGVLGEPLFREVGELVSFPSSNQALQKRAGYRDILRAYVQFEVAAQLTWAGGEDVFKAGQRDVAILYEYWCYLELAKIVSSLCRTPLDLKSLIQETSGGLGLGLRKGSQVVLRGSTVHYRRRLDIEMWFNFTFPGPTGVGEVSWSPRKVADGSWSVQLIPDMSICIRPEAGALDYCDPIWVHFDAKYRVERVLGLKGEKAEGSDDEASGSTGAGAGAKRADLLKMHAYRDGIRQSAGAYILYPGDENQNRRAYTEILPGLGAFRLRPRDGADTEGTAEVHAFVKEVINHVARQTTQHERARYWTSRIYRGRTRAPQQATGHHFLTQPPDDTSVLIGFVKSPEHYEWIVRNKLYNLRADARRGAISRDFLDCALVLLWGRDSGLSPSLWQAAEELETLNAEQLRGLEYPDPRGGAYYCLRLGDEILGWDTPTWDRDLVELLLSKVSPHSLTGVPARLSWGTLVREMALIRQR